MTPTMCPQHCEVLLNLSDSELGQLKRMELIKHVDKAGYSPSQLHKNRARLLNPNSSNESIELNDSGVPDDEWLEISSEDVWQTDSDEPVQFVAESIEPKEIARKWRCCCCTCIYNVNY